MKQTTVTLRQAEELIIDIIKAKKVAMLHGSPGVGKSDLLHKIAEQFNLKVIDVRLSQCDPSDLMGFPKLDGNKAGYVPMDFFPIAGDPLPEGYDGWLVLLDEFPSAPLAVQAAAYKILLDRMVGMNKLHKNVVPVAAGNLATDNAIVNKLGTAAQSRLIHLVIKPSPKEFVEWGDMTGKVDHRVLSFLRFKPELTHKFDPNHSDLTFPCPRTWHFLSDIIKNYEDAIPRSKLPILAGTVGQGCGREFLEYTHVYNSIPTIDAILRDPENIAISDEPSRNHAVAGMVSSNLTAQNGDQLMKYIKRLGLEFQYICLSNAVKKNAALLQVPSINEWAINQTRTMM